MHTTYLWRLLIIKLSPLNYSDVVVLLESTIGIYGTGLLDAIPDDSLKAEYARQEKAGVKLNPAIFANGEWTSLYKGLTGKQYPKRYTYALTRSSIQDGPVPMQSGTSPMLPVVTAVITT